MSDVNKSTTKRKSRAATPLEQLQKKLCEARTIARSNNIPFVAVYNTGTNLSYFADNDVLEAACDVMLRPFLPDSFRSTTRMPFVTMPPLLTTECHIAL